VDHHDHCHISLHCHFAAVESVGDDSVDEGEDDAAVVVVDTDVDGES
jgi:hypothetical protein